VVHPRCQTPPALAPLDGAPACEGAALGAGSLPWLGGGALAALVLAGGCTVGWRSRRIRAAAEATAAR
ncbi:MAG: hypothetical protein WD232_05610, partial [Acidimicrobiales bacterium]